MSNVILGKDFNLGAFGFFLLCLHFFFSHRRNEMSFLKAMHLVNFFDFVITPQFNIHTRVHHKNYVCRMEFLG